MNAKAPHANCANCPLNKRQFAASVLPPNGADIIIVGEMPGVDEIVSGAAFTGATGRVLDHMLAHANVDPSSVAKTNAVLCMPIGDVTPLEAIIACAPRLEYEIAQSGATKVIACGAGANTALDVLQGKTDPRGVLDRAGTVSKHPVRGYTVTSTVNPAYLFRDDGYAPNFVRHLAHGANPRIDVFDAESVKYVVMTPENAERVFDYLYSFPIGAPLAYDVETAHLQWYNTLAREAAELLCVVLTLEDWRSVIIPADLLWLPIHKRFTHWRDTLRELLHRYAVICHNAKFDQNVTAMRLGIEFDAAHDTMAMHHALQELSAHGLKELATEYLGAPNYEKILVDDWFTAHGIKKTDRDYSLLPKANLYKYAAIDGAVTLQLYRLFDAELRLQQMIDRPYHHTIMPVANALPYVERTGMPVDRAHLSDARFDFQTDLTALQAQMTDIVTPLLLQAELDTPAIYAELTRLMQTRVTMPSDTPLYTKSGKLAKRQTVSHYVLQYNPNSPPQTHHILYNLLGFAVPRLIKPTGTNTGKDALAALPSHPFITALAQYRRIKKMLEYVDNIDARADVDDLLHVDFRITGTEIGRLSAANGDHGIPRPDDYYGAMIRSAFVSRADEVFVMADYSQAELRAFALLGNVQFLLDKYRNGQDVHTETALMLEKLGARSFRHFAEYFERGKNGDILAGNTAKAQRTIAKNVNFGGLVYRGKPPGIAAMIGGKVSVSVIADVLAYYSELMPEADQFAESQFQQLLTRGYVETVFGRRRRFYVIGHHNEDEARKSAVHMVVAGSAADLTNTSVAVMVRAGVPVCHTIHDSIIARVPRSQANDTAAFMRETMQSIGAQYMPGIPWVADIDIADRWCAKPTKQPASK